MNFTEEVLANIEFVRTTSAKTQDKIVEVMAFTIKNEEDERLYLLEIGCSLMYFSFTLSSFFEEKLITYWSKRIGYHTKNNMELVNYVLNSLVPHKPDELQLVGWDIVVLIIFQNKRNDKGSLISILYCGINSL